MVADYNKEDFKRVVYHEFGHLLAAYINFRYHEMPSVESITIAPINDILNKSQNSFTGKVRTNKCIYNSVEHKCLGIMCDISGCMFQSFYFNKIEMKLGKGFDECFCPQRSVHMDCHGCYDFQSVKDIIKGNKMSEYLPPLKEYLKRNYDKNLQLLFDPFKHFIDELYKEWWEQFKQNTDKELSIPFKQSILERLQTIISKDDKIKSHYYNFSMGLRFDVF